MSFPAGRGDTVANLAAGKTATALSTQSGYPASNVVDGKPATRWASSYADNQWVQVDLGASLPVARVVVSWESAYATTYTIETSPNGTTWTTVGSVAAGDGGVDNVQLSASNARYVRLTGQTRATSYGFSLYEMEIYSH